VRRSPPVFYLFAAVYGLLLLVSYLMLPLHLDEILQAAAFEHFSFSSMFDWIAKTPGSGPLSYLVQLPFALLSHSRFVLRIPSLCFALGSCFLFFKLARLIPLRRSFLALLVFLAMPVHYYFAGQARPFEQGVFLLLLAALLFFRLVETPTVQNALWYGLVLTACLFTAPASFMPAVGYVLFLLRFASGKSERRALWFALAPTVAPLLLFAPYYVWAHSKVDGAWLTGQPYPGGDWSAWTGAVLAVLLLIGLIGGAWSTFPSWRRLMASSMMLVPVIPGLQRKRLVVFCLSGGALAALIPAAIAAEAAANLTAFTPNDFLWAVPGLVLVSCAGLERLYTLLLPPVLAVLNPVPPVLSSVLSVLLLVLCLPADVFYLLDPPGDLEDLTAIIQPELGDKGCLVFVSEGMSRFLFLLFDPGLETRECRNFNADRIVLVEHPYVVPADKRNAELYFRGLNYIEKKRQGEADGQVVTLDNDTDR
jgi:hypothetical protein